MGLSSFDCHVVDWILVGTFCNLYDLSFQGRGADAPVILRGNIQLISVFVGCFVVNMSKILLTS